MSEACEANHQTVSEACEANNQTVSEPIDTARLADWMDAAALPGKGELLQARFLSGGTQNVIYELTRGEARCVIRMPPPSAPPDRDKGILREWRIIEALDGTDVPHTAAVGPAAPASRSLGPGARVCGVRCSICSIRNLVGAAACFTLA